MMTQLGGHILRVIAVLAACISSAFAGNSVLIFGNSFSSSNAGLYANGQTINPGAVSAQLVVNAATAGMQAAIVNPGASFTDGSALDLTDNGDADGFVANRLGDGNAAWGQLSSGEEREQPCHRHIQLHKTPVDRRLPLFPRQRRGPVLFHPPK